MMVRNLAVAFLVSTAQALAQDMSGIKMDNKSDAEGAQIVVTINPEGRVSAVAGKALPTISSCGTSSILQVKIINQGGTTAPLRAKFVDAPESVMLHDTSLLLSGRPEDRRTLHITSHRTQATDLTIAFSFANGRGDLADRDRVHLLFRCTRNW